MKRLLIIALVSVAAVLASYGVFRFARFLSFLDD
jgi:hypothetical protein